MEGGCANDYVYVFGDPVNASDLSGQALDRCNDAAVFGTGGMIALRWIPSIKRYEFNIQVFPPWSEMGTQAFFKVKMTHYGQGKQLDSETFKKSGVGAGYGFHGRFDNRYGKKGSKGYSHGEMIRLELDVRIYDPSGNMIAGVRGILRCTV